MNHELYMQRALALAAKGAGWVCPNPQVGAVIVRDGEVIGEGYHTRCGNLHAEREALEAAGCKVWSFPAAEDGSISIPALLDRMGQEGFDSLIVEGGAQTAGAFVDAGCVDHVQAYIAPKMTGGKNAPSPVAGLGIALMGDALELGNVTIEQYGRDILVSGDVKINER